MSHLLRLTLAVLIAQCGVGVLAQESASEVQAAREVFERNLDSIRNRDRAAYLATYLESESFTASTLTGLVSGFDRFAAQESAWPDTFDASDLQLAGVAPGVVYGTYRYRVRYGADEVSGLSQRLFVRTDDGWRIAVTGAMAAPPGTPPPPRAIVGATLIDGRGGAPITDATVIVRGGKIDCAGTAAECRVPSEGVEITDAAGMWLTPGLVDAHVHFSQTGWADARPDALDVRDRYPYAAVIAGLERNPERFARSYVCSGVTTVFDVGGYPWTLALPERFRHDTRAPRVVAAGPLLSTLDHWLNLPAERQFIAPKSEDAVRSAVEYLADRGSSAIKFWFIVTPDLTVSQGAPIVTAAGREAARAGLPFIVHATGLAEAKIALRAGANLFVHSIDDLPLDEEFIALARRTGTIVIPTLIVPAGYRAMFGAAATGTAPAVDDPNGCVDRATLARIAETASLPFAMTPQQQEIQEARYIRRRAMAAANLMTLVRAGIPVATGTDAGNPLTLHGPSIYAEMEAMQSAGMTPMQVITASTLTASRAMGLEAETGSIKPGKTADLLLLAEDPGADVSNFRRLRFVMRAGELRSIEELSAAAVGSTPEEAE
jgi:imidazolonepropionase-like amidohydrolase